MEGAMLYLVWALAGLQEEGVSEGAGLMAGVLGVAFLAFMCAFTLLLIVSVWKVFTKAGKPGWASIIPIYNLIVMLEITGKPIWWIVLFLIPFVNFVAAILLSLALSEKFGKSTGFGIGLALVSFVFFPILAFGDARYRG
jgi:hypothetical protein